MTLTSILIVFFHLAIISAIALLYHKSKRERQRLEAQIKEERRSHEIQKKSLSEKLKKSNDSLKNALKKIECLNAEPKTDRQDNMNLSNGKARYEEFRQTPICLEILNTVAQLHADPKAVLKSNIIVKEYKAFALSKLQKALLLKTVDSCFPEMTSVGEQTNLSQHDLLYLSLYLLQLDNMSICVLLQDSYFTCRRHTMNLEQTFNCKYGLTSFLMEYIFN